MRKFQMIFPCKMQLSDMKAMGDGTFFCNSCATHVTDVRDNKVPIQNIKCGIFNAKDVVYNSLNIRVPIHHKVKISMLALVGLTTFLENNIQAQDTSSVVRNAEILSNLKLPLTIKGQVLGDDNIPVFSATIALYKEGQKTNVGTGTDFDGNFSLTINESDVFNGMVEFIVNSVGFLPDTVSTETKSTKLLKIKLTPQYNSVEDILAVGGIGSKVSTKRKSITSTRRTRKK